MRKTKPLRSAELISLSRQLAFVVDSDLSLQEGLSLIAEQTKSKPVRELLLRTEAHLNEGLSLGEAFAKEPSLPDFYTNMVTLGEQSGNLVKVLNRVADTYEKDAKINSKVMSAVTYPIILAVLMICVIVLLLVEVLPMFDEVLAGLGGEMPGITRVLMGIGQFIGSYFYIILAVIAAIVLAVIIMRQTRGGAEMLDGIKMRRRIPKNIACVRFSRNLAMLIRSGIGIAESVKWAAATMMNTKLKSLATQAAERIEQGATLKEALASLGLFSGLLLRVLAVAEGTGHTDDMLDKAADNLEEQLDERLTRLTTVLEPALIIVLSVIVGIVLISVILPVTRIMNAVG